MIVTLDGRKVTDANALRNQIASTRPGSSVSLGVLRDGKTELARPGWWSGSGRNGRHLPAGEEGETSSFGMSVSPLTPRIAERLELPPTAKGLVVTDVDPAGAAAPPAFSRAMSSRASTTVTSRARVGPAPSDGHETDKPALVLVNRRGASLFVAVPREQA